MRRLNPRSCGHRDEKLKNDGGRTRRNGKRTDANGRARSPDHQYTLTVEQTAELFAAAGLPRSVRAIQKYCALTKLDCHKVETETGEKYLVAPYSVERHISYINEVRPVATRRDQSRTDANVRTIEDKRGHLLRGPANGTEQSRTDAPARPRCATLSPYDGERL
jgi:hypothetical protein